MLRALWFAVKLSVLIAIGLWFANRPGVVTVEWMGYTIEARVGFTLLCLFILLLLILGVHSLVIAVSRLPLGLRRYRTARDHNKGLRALTRGLTAIAAGDAEAISIQARRVRALLPQNENIAVLLEAQAAWMNGDHGTARSAFRQLLDDRDTAFIGMRGLLSQAVERGELNRALEISQKALKMYPRQGWVLRLVYGLEVKQAAWDEARKTLARAVKYKAIAPEKAVSDRVAMIVLEADAAMGRHDEPGAMRLLQKALKLDLRHLPAILRLAPLLILRKKRSAAIRLLEGAWREQPHPDIVPLWGALAPQNKPQDPTQRLRWFERLISLNPASEESYMAAAQAAIEAQLWGEARQFLMRADHIGHSARLYRNFSKLEQAQGRHESARDYLAKAAGAPPDKVWTCTETGRIYERWMPVAMPHGAFNTIVWDYPKSHAFSEEKFLPSARILIAPPL